MDLYLNCVKHLVNPPQEYNIDIHNRWIQLKDSDQGYDDGLSPFMVTMSASVQGTLLMDYFDVVL